MKSRHNSQLKHSPKLEAMKAGFLFTPPVTILAITAFIPVFGCTPIDLCTVIPLPQCPQNGGRMGMQMDPCELEMFEIECLLWKEEK